MNLLVFTLVIVIIVALLVWACDSIAMPSTPKVIIRVSVILIGVLLIAQRAGLL